MAQSVRAERTRRNFADESNRYDVKRERLVRCARMLAENGNAAKISVTSITTTMGITRGLFYYYFNGKEELNEAIVETYISDLMTMVMGSYQEDASREDAVRTVVSCVRAWIFDQNGEFNPMWHVLQEMELVDFTRQRVSKELAVFFVNAGLLARHGKVDDEVLLNHARFVAIAILGECRLHPDVSVDAITDAACAALRYRRRRPACDGAIEEF